MRFRKEQSITQRLNKNGTWTFLVRIRMDEGEISKSFNEKDYPTTKTAFDAAVNFRNRAMYELTQGIAMRKNNATVREMFEYYLDHTTDSYKTKDYHQKLFNKYISFKDEKVQQLTKAMVQEDLNKMVEIASNDTIGRVFSIYKDDIIGSALMQEIVFKDVTLAVQKPKSHMNYFKRGVTTDRETILKVEELMHKYVANKYDAKVIVCLMEVLYYTGMRPAEVEVLTREDIKGDYISVTKELGSSMDRMNVVRRPKTPNSVRNVPIHQNLKPILRDLFSFAKYDELFLRENGDYMNSSWVGNIIRRICKKEGLEFNLYRMRHNMATELITNNVDSRTTMEILGHAHYDMSLYYATSNQKLKEKALELIH